MFAIGYVNGFDNKDDAELKRQYDAIVTYCHENGYNMEGMFGHVDADGNRLPSEKVTAVPYALDMLENGEAEILVVSEARQLFFGTGWQSFLKDFYDRVNGIGAKIVTCSPPSIEDVLKKF